MPNFNMLARQANKLFGDKCFKGSWDHTDDNKAENKWNLL